MRAFWGRLAPAFEVHGFICVARESVARTAGPPFEPNESLSLSGGLSERTTWVE